MFEQFFGFFGFFFHVRQSSVFNEFSTIAANDYLCVLMVLRCNGTYPQWAAIVLMTVSIN